ncbi:MAG: nicotinamide mononucleotide transporter [Bacteroidetes bacterium]|nr:nicotinamide mononucleotide transporter [Bacteroidota bacterium]
MLSGIIAVWLTVKHSVWCFPIGIVNVLLYAWLFSHPLYVFMPIHYCNVFM